MNLQCLFTVVVGSLEKRLGSPTFVCL